MKRLLTYCAIFLLSGCAPVQPQGCLEGLPEMFPDYSGVTVPCNIAPLDFAYTPADATACDAPCILRLSASGVTVDVRGPEFDIPLKGWRALLAASLEGGAQEGEVSASVLVKRDGTWLAYEPFSIKISADRIDPYVTYRLIEPGYETWNVMGIYQRCLEDFTQTPVIENSATGKNCMNCHSFPARDASRMVFHMRGANGGTYITDGPAVEKLNTKTPQTISAVVYPQWSADGRYIAFSVNDIWQVFHSTNPNRAEIYDTVSDVVVYDVAGHSLSSCPQLQQPDRLETFPTFSPDGRTLYFCSSPRCNVPEDYRDIRYSICSISFDPESGEFGAQVDTLYNARVSGKCATFPRVSPDGRTLMFTQASYGCFSIWHKDADLYVIDLQSGEVRELEGANSPDVESYHSWSSNGRWTVFSSRRLDGLYTRLFICHIDSFGRASKPFLLPQRKSTFYQDLFKSYNIPELSTGRVTASPRELARCALESPGTDLTFKQQTTL